MASEKEKSNPQIPGQPEASTEKHNLKQQGGPAKPSQAEGDEETVDEALRNQERKSK